MHVSEAAAARYLLLGAVLLGVLVLGEGFGVSALTGSTVIAAAAQQPPAARGGQRGGAPAEPPKNLQVMPKDTPREEVITRMRGIVQALGVQCGYCHIFEGAGNPANDFASDTKQPKLVARVMMRMTGDINTKLAAEINKPADQLTRVGCATCHRGSAIPKVDPPPAAAAGAAPAQAPPPGR
jgi:Photosynthetic reaction centre cytochrome C subunit